MGLIAQIQNDVKTITTKGDDFALPVIFSVTNGVTVTTVTCNAIAVKHSIEVYDEEMRAIGRNARVTVSELALRELDYPVRDTNNRVTLLGNLVTWTDVSGIQATYSIRHHYPDETLGLTVCFLSEYGAVTPPGRVIIGWIVSEFTLTIVATPDGSTQTLANGDAIPAQYALNNDGTLTIPYVGGYEVLTPFIIDNGVIQDMPYNKTTGTFDNSRYGGFLIDNLISFNASIPIWKS